MPPISDGMRECVRRVGCPIWGLMALRMCERFICAEEFVAHWGFPGAMVIFGSPLVQQAHLNGPHVEREIERLIVAQKQRF